MLRLFLILSVFAAAEAEAAGCNDAMLSITDWSVGQASKGSVEIKLRFRSNAPKQIRMLQGLAYFYDALDERIGALPVGPDAIIPAGGEYTEHRTWSDHLFGRLLKLRKQDVKTATCVKAVLYENGSKETF
ncbi:hypothetical protein [Sinorhizobium medicae]|uniref:hypothetical protein n=1 Tax=Sinorhizobium medicae TaxID=110321 RepID=UPI000FE107AA|nr:hypothetical protein [Sinorhizobium medicae]RVI96123.1 hypothetical protein CN183_33225 [Sinorhizobium medicae]